MTRQSLALRALRFTVAAANLLVAGYLLAVEQTFGGPGLLVLLAFILIVGASPSARRGT